MDTRKLTFSKGSEPHCQAQIYQEDGDGRTLALTYSDNEGAIAEELVKRWNAYPEQRKALSLCEAELFAQCGDQKRAMQYVEMARRALGDNAGPPPQDGPKAYTVVLLDPRPDAEGLQFHVHSSSPSMAILEAKAQAFQEEEADGRVDDPDYNMDEERQGLWVITVYEGHLTNLVQ